MPSGLGRKTGIVWIMFISDVLSLIYRVRCRRGRHLLYRDSRRRICRFLLCIADDDGRYCWRAEESKESYGKKGSTIMHNVSELARSLLFNNRNRLAHFSLRRVSRRRVVWDGTLTRLPRVYIGDTSKSITLWPPNKQGEKNIHASAGLQSASQRMTSSRPAGAGDIAK